jgi:uncharacterized protein involved in exopolysaccharide biosynthesis
MIRYLETFYRHRLLVLMPLFLALAISVSFALAQPRTYESSARIWFYGSNFILAGQSNTGVADQQAAVLRELLDSRSFCAEIGRRGPLANYLEAAAAVPSSFLNRLAAKFGLSGWSATSGPVDDSVYAILRRTVKVGASGPQVVAITFDAPSPEVATGTVQALVDQFSDEILANRRTQAQVVVDFFDQQVKAQADAVAAADASLRKYLAAHPLSRTSGPDADVTLIALQRTADQARRQYDQSLPELDQAKLDLAAQQQAGGAGFRLIDPPSLPGRPTRLLSVLLRPAVAGLSAGLFLAAISLLALTAADSSLRRADEARRALGLRLVGEIPRIG